MGLGRISGNGEALKEASNSLLKPNGVNERVVGMDFPPLLLSPSLFSMSERFFPGTATFRVYPIVGAPFVLVSTICVPHQ